ncbi:MAG: GYD domain-containing protein [Nitrospirota bacterium]|nr:GYD domain-containing protein [Nitrospirota bacterium]
MQTFLMLTRVSPEGLSTPGTLEKLEKRLMNHLRTECPQVKWVHNYAVLGAFDYVDMFEAPDIETATRVAMLVRTYGHAHVEVWPATSWSRFKEMLHPVSQVA